MTIAELFREKKISHRSYHVCRANNIEDLNQLEEYLFTNKNFLRLQNCGKKSNNELLELSKNYEKSKNQEDLSQLNLFESTFPLLNRKQQKLINSIILVLTNNLTPRNRNALIGYIGEEITIDIFINKIYENRDFKITKIKNVGKSSIVELETYFNTVKSLTKLVIVN